jgi:hypothetical protein
MSSNKWNIAFTNLIRQTDGAAWGNWTLNPDVRPGAVGFIDSLTGNFTRITSLPSAKFVKFVNPKIWSVESSSVHRTESNVDFTGEYQDPSSNTKVKTGLKVAWQFSDENSIASNATILSTEDVDDYTRLMEKNFAWFLQEATSANWATPDGKGILQGFGMITHVNWCSGGVNLGAQNSDSSFDLTGSIDGIGAITGAGTVEAGIKGSYKEMNESKAMEKHIWPDESNVPAKDDVAISFKFASFDGRVIVPAWRQPLDGFSLNFDNSNGGTYIADCNITFDSASAPSMSPMSCTASGGTSSSLNGIPLDAKNLVVEISLEDGDTYRYRYPSPMVGFPHGRATFDIYGVWPWGSHVDVSF